MNVYDVRNEFQGGYTTPRTSTRYIIVHHAAALYSPSAGLDDVRAVARYHTVDRGWPGIGYHIALAEETQGGAIARYNLSAENLQRAHILGRNDEALGIACLTNFTALPAKKWIDALVLALRDLEAEPAGGREQRRRAASACRHLPGASGPQELLRPLRWSLAA
jgi:hypothetical protein